MDDFRTPKKRSHGSVDGFVPAKPSQFRSGSDLNAFNQYYKPKSTLPPSQDTIIPRVDSFNKQDGFTAFEQPIIGKPGEKDKSEELTLAFDDEEKPSHAPHKTNQDKPKRRRFLFRRKHKAKKHHKHPKLRIIWRSTAAFAMLLVLVGGGLALRAYLTSRNIFKGGGNSVVLNNQNVDPTQLKGEGDGRVNILILGKGGEEQRDGPELTDTIILASIDPIAKEASLLSVPRDLWVKSPSGYQSKINEVYANAKYAVLNNYSFKLRTSDEAKEKAEKAGIDAIKETMTNVLGVPVHYYTMIDFAGFKKAIDTVGGIQIDVKEALVDPTMAWQNGGKATIAPVGMQTFDGKRALMYARSRKGTNGTDFGRAERQREVILALKDKVLSTGTLANPLKINQLMSDFGGQVSTDFSVNEILRVYDLAKEISGDKVISVGLDDYVKGEAINGLSAQVPKAGTYDYSEIQNYVRNIMRDAFLKSEDAKIMILNGTDRAGLATTKSKELKSYGYNVISVGDAPTKTYTNTLLIDMRDGTNKYTLNYLEKRLGVKATTSLPDKSIDASTADFVIILGSNEKSSSQN